MSLEFNPLKTNGVYSKIFINRASYMLIKINTTPFAHMEEETAHFIVKVNPKYDEVLLDRVSAYMERIYAVNHADIFIRIQQANLVKIERRKKTVPPAKCCVRIYDKVLDLL